MSTEYRCEHLITDPATADDHRFAHDAQKICDHINRRVAECTGGAHDPRARLFIEEALRGMDPETVDLMGLHLKEVSLRERVAA